MQISDHAVARLLLQLLGVHVHIADHVVARLLLQLLGVHVHIADHVVARLLLPLLAGARADSGPCSDEAVVTITGGCTCR